MDLLQVKCIILVGYKDNYIIYTSATPRLGVEELKGQCRYFDQGVQR